MTTSSTPLKDAKLDIDNLYREETITDLRLGQIQVMTPIKADGEADPDRETMFIAHSQIMTQMGALPLQGAIEAASLAEAIEKFPDALDAAMEKLQEEAHRMQREEASRIVTPGDSNQGNIII